MSQAKSIRPFHAGTVESICRSIGDYYTGTELTQVITDANLGKYDPGNGTKWRRLHEAIVTHQNKYQNGAALLAFVKAALAPQRILARERANGIPGSGSTLRDEVNQALSMSALEVDAAGILRKVKGTSTVEDARRRGGRLKTILKERGNHSEVIAQCPDSLGREGYYDVVFEAMKGLRARISTMSGLDLDGYKLIDATMAGKSPAIRFSTLITDTERNEQVGISNLTKGLFSAFRNPIAHENRSNWSISEPDALDILGTISLIHRRLDKARVVLPDSLHRTT